MKKSLVFPAVILILASMACSFNFDLGNSGRSTIPVETLDINVPAPQSGSAARLVVNMGAGKLEVTPDSTALVSGSVRYNLADWKPQITTRGDTTTLEQKTVESLNLSTDIINEWALALNPALTYDLELNAGAYEGSLDLSGLSISELDISDGASKAEVVFSEPNPVVMERFSYQTGASEVRLSGLANANFNQLTFQCGAGSYTLNFGGTLKRDAAVSISGGVSQITIIVPAGMNAQVETSGALNNVDASGDWSQNNNVYETGGSGPLLTIRVEMGVGNLQLRSE
jgi:N-terminal domain of toast_rack, DUF2154